MYAIIQSKEVNSRFVDVVKLSEGARLTEAGYIVGDYKCIFPKVSIKAARNIMTILLNEGI